MSTVIVIYRVEERPQGALFKLSKQNEPDYVSTEQIQGVAAIIDEVDAGREEEAV